MFTRSTKVLLLAAVFTTAGMAGTLRPLQSMNGGHPLPSTEYLIKNVVQVSSIDANCGATVEKGNITVTKAFGADDSAVAEFGY